MTQRWGTAVIGQVDTLPFLRDTIYADDLEGVLIGVVSPHRLSPSIGRCRVPSCHRRWARCGAPPAPTTQAGRRTSQPVVWWLYTTSSPTLSDGGHPQSECGPGCVPVQERQLGPASFAWRLQGRTSRVGLRCRIERMPGGTARTGQQRHRASRGQTMHRRLPIGSAYSGLAMRHRT
jgi:hypothetical protein